MFWNLPQVFVIQLKRFDFAYYYDRVSYLKNTDAVYYEMKYGLFVLLLNICVYCDLLTLHIVLLCLNV